MRYRQSAFCGLFSFGKIDCAQRKNQTACSHARMVSSLDIGRLPATEMKRSGIEVRKQSIWKRRRGRLPATEMERKRNRGMQAVNRKRSIGRLPATEMECQTETVHAEEKVTKGV